MLFRSADTPLDWAAAGVTEKTSVDLRLDPNVTVLSIVAGELLRMASLLIAVEPMAPLRGGNQLGEIGTPMPNGLIGKDRAS